MRGCGPVDDVSRRRTPFTAPWRITSKAVSRAPSRTNSENWGRSIGYYGDEDDTTRGYEAVILYVRKGLGHLEIILPVIQFAFEVQRGLRKPWTLVPLSYGWGDELKHLGTDILIRYVNQDADSRHYAKDLCNLAGQELEPGTAVVKQLFPRTDIRSLYGGKTGVTRNDLLVFVDGEGQLALDPALLRRARVRARDIVQVSVSDERDGCEWKMGVEV